MQTAHLDKIELHDNVLTASGKNYRVAFTVQPRDTYLVLRIREFEEPTPGTLMKLRFHLGPDNLFTLTRLDYMSVPHDNGKTLEWPWIWGRPEVTDRTLASGSTSNNQHPTPNVQAGNPDLDVGRWALDVGRSDSIEAAIPSQTQQYTEADANPLGAFAIQRVGTDEEFDENLLRMWVHDGLPHPKVEGEWTLERARAWLREWQDRFADQSCLVIGAKNRAELDTMTEWAEKLGMKRVYLHTDTWRGEYWPRNHSYLHVNTNVFPRGEQDLNEYTAALHEKGMSFAVHSTVISIGRNDPDYVRNGLHSDLARWVRGTLDRDAGKGDTTLFFRPAPGAKYPRITRHEWGGPDTMPSFMNLQLFLVGDELIEVGSVERDGTRSRPTEDPTQKSRPGASPGQRTTGGDGTRSRPTEDATYARRPGASPGHAKAEEGVNEDVWVLKNCRRGAWGTTRAAHPAGTNTDGMLRGYGQAFVPDSDSAPFEETIQRWADFCSRNNVDHLECDALEIHQDRPWGAAKFSWLLASHLSLPSTSNTSSGRPLPFHIEYWFRGSRKVMANHARAGVAGGASLPLYLHSDIRQATGPYEILYKPAQMVGGGGNSFNVSYPWPMFGVTPEILANHGMVPEVERLIGDWRAVLPAITSEQREAIARAYSEYRGAAGRNNQAATDVLFRPEIVGGEKRIVPLRLVGRAGGELNWGFGQEFGPIVPRQYVRTGETLALTNANHAQEPEFVIRVMGALVEAEEENQHPTSNIQHPTSKEATAIEESYATGTTTDFRVHPLNSARHIWPAAAMHEGEAMRGKVDVRYAFAVPDLAAIKRSRLYLQVDDEAVAFMNGKKVFSGGRYDQALFVDLTNLRQGKNTLLIKATNYGAPGCVTAALHLGTADGTRVLASDSSWQGRPVRLAQGRPENGTWGAVADLGAYGSTGWPKAKPQMSVLRRDLMPGGSTIEPADGHELTVLPSGQSDSFEEIPRQARDDSLQDSSITSNLSFRAKPRRRPTGGLPDAQHLERSGNLHSGNEHAAIEGPALEIICRNDASTVATHLDDRPAWATLLDMSDARGIGCTVTGDGSGAVLVITIGEHHKRDYVIPIDFTGTREVQIPSGEVAWGHSKWGWRWGATKFDYSRIRTVRAGFGTVPPKTHARVTVSNIRPLRETPTWLQDFTIRVGADGELTVPGTIPSDHYLWYRGGDSVGLYDINWNKVRDIPVRKHDFVFPTGKLTVELNANSADQLPWLETQFFTKGKPLP